MRITDVEVIEFRTTSRGRPTRWNYGLWSNEERETTATVTRIATDEGIDGCMVGGGKAAIEGVMKPMLVGEDPMYRERLWNWMDQSATFSRQIHESDAGVMDGDGNVVASDIPGLGIDLDWSYIDDNRI